VECTDNVSAKGTPPSTSLKSFNISEKKTPSKEAVSTERAGKERRGCNDVGEIAGDNEHMTGEHRFLLSAFYTLHFYAQFLSFKMFFNIND